MPNYRGVDSIFWALKNSDFKNIGYTIHHIDQGIDTGPCITQKKILIKKNANVHLVFFKVIIAGVNELIKIVKNKDFVNKKKYQSNIKGKLYLSKHIEEIEINDIFLKGCINQ